jgi:hypothetical protein
VWEVWKIPTGPGSAPPEAIQVTRRGGYDAVESPDGKWLYYTKTIPISGLWRMPTAGGEEVQVLQALASYTVFDDGIYFLKPSGATTLLQFLALANGSIQSLATTGKRPVGGLTVSPDRRWLLFAQMDQEGADLMLVENFR